MPCYIDDPLPHKIIQELHHLVCARENFFSLLGKLLRELRWYNMLLPRSILSLNLVSRLVATWEDFIGRIFCIHMEKEGVCTCTYVRIYVCTCTWFLDITKYSYLIQYVKANLTHFQCLICVIQLYTYLTSTSIWTLWVWPCIERNKAFADLRSFHGFQKPPTS